MPTPEIPSVRLARGVPDLAALGARRFEDFLDGARGLVTGDRAEVLSRTGASEVVRVPLPGTPDASGRQHEAPRGAGTGYLRVESWRGGARELLEARLTAPRSSSMAARRWNLLCHLRAAGVATPEPVAVGERPGPLVAAESFLVTRELEGFVPLPTWLADVPNGAARRLGVVALGHALAAFLRAGVACPELDAHGVHVGGEHAQGDGDCAARGIEELRTERALRRGRELRMLRLPTVAIDAIAGGRIVRRPSRRRRAALLGRLAAGCRDASPRELARILLLAGPEGRDVAQSRARGLSARTRATASDSALS